MMRLISGTRRSDVQLVLEPEELYSRIGQPQPGRPREPDPDIVVVQVSEARAHAEAHVPDARLVEPRELVSGIRPATGKLPPTATLEALLGRIGYRPEAVVVAYDDEGGGWAGRFLWTLDVIGHRRAACLNGGIHAWHAEGLPLESGPVAVAATDVTLTLDPRPAVEIEELLARLDDDRLTLWDSRSREEYEGRKVVAARGGHIPGARHLDWLELMDRARGLRLRRDLAELLESRGITPEKEVVVYCQTHHRSGLAYLAARHLGFPDVRAYPGSWSEWGNRTDTPVQTGG